uniref:hypothetical protein n=1 Tax=Singerocybe alboinfundibuliformis TaxID=1346812 RepID=UPI0030FEBACD
MSPCSKTHIISSPSGLGILSGSTLPCLDSLMTFVNSRFLPILAPTSRPILLPRAAAPVVVAINPILWRAGKLLDALTAALPTAAAAAPTPNLGRPTLRASKRTSLPVSITFSPNSVLISNL